MTAVPPGEPGNPRSTRTLLRVTGMVSLLIGLLWVGQGLGVIPGSFMTGDPTWFVIGAVLTLVGIVLLLAARGRGSSRPDPRR